MPPMKIVLCAKQFAVAVITATIFSSGQPIAAQPNEAVDYEKPSLLTGTINETSSGTNKILFTFKRTAVRSNSTVFITRDFMYPNGSIAAREQIVFERGQLTSFQLDEKQTGARGSARIVADTKNAARQKILFDWVTTEGGKTKTKMDSEAFQSETLVGDMIPYFIVAHWNELVRGNEVSFRFIASSRLETVGFKFVKESEMTWRGKPALRLRMEPSSVIIRQIVDPLFFVVEKDGAHRVLEYVGRTTPKARDGNKWKDLDARTVYDW
jgi:hypothetical protein